jgi:thymidylate kinase
MWSVGHERPARAVLMSNNMNNHIYYIHVEGMDLAGKTTARRDLVTALGGDCRVRHNSLCSSNPVYELADGLRKEDRLGGESLGYLYVAALPCDLERYTPLRSHTIQDSTILLRSLAYHTVARTPFVVDSLKAMLPRHPRFMRSFVLTASLAVRERRLERRRQRQTEEIAPDDLMILRAPDSFLAMEEALVRLAQEHFSAVVIDTSEMSGQAVVESILSAGPIS